MNFEFSFLKKGFLVAAIGLGLSSSLVSCYTNPVTGRKGLNLVDDQTVNSMSSSQYNEFLKQNPPANNTTEGQMVQRVGIRMQQAVLEYLNSIKRGEVTRGYQWSFNYIKNNQANAFCMPGGRVIVFSGIMPIARDEEGLAVIMGHEIAHAIAQHGNERMSQGLVQQLGGLALSVAVSSKPAETQRLFNTAYGVTTTVGAMLPFSRKHESEADEMGLIFMALAGYNPNAAVPFWQRMAQKGGGQNPPELLSTHPAPASRISDIQKLIPKAMKYYKPRN